MKLSGAEIVVESLIQEGVTSIFGYPGAAIMDVYDYLEKSPIRHYLVRHEQGAVHMRRRVCPNFRQGWCLSGDFRAGGHQYGNRNRLGFYGFHSNRCFYRSGPNPFNRQRCLSGSGYRGHYPSLHQAQLSGQEGRRSGPGHQGGLLLSPVPADRGRSWWICLKTYCMTKRNLSISRK